MKKKNPQYLSQDMQDRIVKYLEPYMDVFLILRLLYYGSFPGAVSIVLAGAHHTSRIFKYFQKYSSAKVLYVEDVEDQGARYGLFETAQQWLEAGPK